MIRRKLTALAAVAIENKRVSKSGGRARGDHWKEALQRATGPSRYRIARQLCRKLNNRRELNLSAILKSAFRYIRSGLQAGRCAVGRTPRNVNGHNRKIRN